MGAVFFGQPEVVAIYVEPGTFRAALELVDGEGIRGGSREAIKLTELMRQFAGYVEAGGRLPDHLELCFAELVLLLAASSATPTGGGG